MQYFKPAGDFFVGDCRPFWHDGVFHLYWLLDEQHHQTLGGLGRRSDRWDDPAHTSTRFALMQASFDALAFAVDPGPKQVVPF